MSKRSPTNPPRPRRISPYRLFGGIALIAVVILGVRLSTALAWPTYIIWPLVLTPLTFVFYWYDKHQSQGTGLRVPERVLLLLALGGGFVGGFLAMLLLRHKTRHRYFWLAQGVGLALWIGLAWWQIGGGP